MTTLDYVRAPGSRLFSAVIGPPDLRPKKIRLPIRNGKVNPDGAIIAHGVTIGASREFAEDFYRKNGYAPEFVEIP